MGSSSSLSVVLVFVLSLWSGPQSLNPDKFRGLILPFALLL